MQLNMQKMHSKTAKVNVETTKNAYLYSILLACYTFDQKNEIYRYFVMVTNYLKLVRLMINTVLYHMLQCLLMFDTILRFN